MSQLLVYVFSVVLSVCPMPPIQETGLATWYGAGNYHGDVRADGQEFNPLEVGCAHRTIPLGTEIVVEAQDGAVLVCEVNDRGPYWAIDDRGRGFVKTDLEAPGEYRGPLDLSLGAARELFGVEGRPPNGIVNIRYWSK